MLRLKMYMHVPGKFQMSFGLYLTLGLKRQPLHILLSMIHRDTPINYLQVHFVKTHFWLGLLLNHVMVIPENLLQAVCMIHIILPKPSLGS